MTPREFSNALQGYIEEQEQASKERWEQARMVAYYSIAAHVKKGKTMAQLIPLPWDRPTMQKNPFGPSEPPTPEQLEWMDKKLLKSIREWQDRQSGVS